MYYNPQSLRNKYISGWAFVTNTMSYLREKSFFMCKKS